MASVGGSIRAQLVAANIAGINGIYRDFAPPDTAKPYITYRDELGNTPQLLGDKLVLTRRRMVQVDLWQGRQEEDTTLVNQVVAALDGISRFNDETYIYRLRVSDIQRLVSFEDNLVHHALTLDVYQKA
jgi:hypothetical protein